MTKVVFYRSCGAFYGFEEQGHTGYGEAGDDVLCAALSAMTMLIMAYFYQLNDLIEEYSDYLEVNVIDRDYR